MSAGQPYRAPGPVEPAAAAPPADVGPLRSVHTPPPLAWALVGPSLITAVLTAIFFGLAEGPAVLVLLVFATACFAILAFGPLRLRGYAVALHDAGLVVSRRGVARQVAFEDVDEIWFETDVLAKHAGTAIRALRLVTYGREVHRVLLGVRGAATVVAAVLKVCSTPLLAEARAAFGSGEALTFGDVRLDRDGITVGRRTRPWRAIRLAVVGRGRLRLYRGLPIFAWRTVRLDRVPHPMVLLALVASAAPKLRVDDPFIVPFASASEQAEATAAAGGDRTVALRNMLAGGTAFLIGALVTWASVSSCSSPSGRVLWYGPMIFGAFLFYQGLRAYLSRR